MKPEHGGFLADDEAQSLAVVVGVTAWDDAVISQFYLSSASSAKIPS